MRQHTADRAIAGRRRRWRRERSGNPGERGAPRRAVRLARADVERMMEGRPPGSTLEEALEVFEVFSSGTLADEVYVLEDVGGKRIAIAPAALKAKYRKE